MTDKELLTIAHDAAAFAYVPYSKFPVGAALECADGSVFTGCNVENSSFGGTICAERVAICKAISEGHTAFSRIAIYGSASENYCYPCGICRQFMSEFGTDIEILCSNKRGRYVSYRLSELAPHTFQL